MTPSDRDQYEARIDQLEEWLSNSRVCFYCGEPLIQLRDGSDYGTTECWDCDNPECPHENDPENNPLNRKPITVEWLEREWGFQKKSSYQVRQIGDAWEIRGSQFQIAVIMRENMCWEFYLHDFGHRWPLKLSKESELNVLLAALGVRK